jgi:Zn-dependent protease
MESFAANLQQFVVQFPPFVMAVCFHEYAHGRMAKAWGDQTAQEQGRLTLNPVAHADVLGTLVFPAINMLSGMNLLFGWAKPVPIDPRRFRKFRPGLFWVSLAGVMMNVLLAAISAFACAAIQRWASPDFYLFEPLVRMTIASISINYALAIFNLVPLPPLDGSKIVESFLPYRMAQKYESLAQYSFFILMALLLTGALSVLSGPIVWCTKLTLYFALLLFQVPLT